MEDSKEERPEEDLSADGDDDGEPSDDDDGGVAVEEEVARGFSSTVNFSFKINSLTTAKSSSMQEGNILAHKILLTFGMKTLDFLSLFEKWYILTE